MENDYYVLGFCTKKYLDSLTDQCKGEVWIVDSDYYCWNGKAWVCMTEEELYPMQSTHNEKLFTVSELRSFLKDFKGDENTPIYVGSNSILSISYEKDRVIFNV